MTGLRLWVDVIQTKSTFPKLSKGQTVPFPFSSSMFTIRLREQSSVAISMVWSKSKMEPWPTTTTTGCPNIALMQFRKQSQVPWEHQSNFCFNEKVPRNTWIYLHVQKQSLLKQNWKLKVCANFYMKISCQNKQKIPILIWVCSNIAVTIHLT